VSLSTIRAALATTLRGISGVVNVEEEESEGTDEQTGYAARTDVDRVHFWRVKAWPTKGEYGAGYVEPRIALRVQGFYGVAREAPAEGVVSDRLFSDLAALVLTTLQAASNRNPGDCVETSEPEMAPAHARMVQVGSKRVRCHIAEIAYTAQEE
jgi:hypothetical protein